MTQPPFRYFPERKHGNQKTINNKPQPFKVKPAVITKYFTAGQSAKEIEDTIDRALALYFENQHIPEEQEEHSLDE